MLIEGHLIGLLAIGATLRNERDNTRAAGVTSSWDKRRAGEWDSGTRVSGGAAEST